MPYAVAFSERAEKELAALPESIQSRITGALRAIAPHPSRGPNIRKLRGQSGYRLRVGEYRVVYEIHRQQVTVLVIRVAHRRDVYR